ncbi:hypothetical protein TURU_059474 [Turdus rufiventris]|nr:hypothetical protein TURU_059474 [Turdus rufiventris]
MILLRCCSMMCVGFLLLLFLVFIIYRLLHAEAENPTGEKANADLALVHGPCPKNLSNSPEGPLGTRRGSEPSPGLKVKNPFSIMVEINFEVILLTCACELCITEWFGLEETLKLTLFPPPALPMDTFHYPRLLQALSNLALDTSRDPGAATASLGTLCRDLPTLIEKNFVLISHLTFSV